MCEKTFDGIAKKPVAEWRSWDLKCIHREVSVRPSVLLVAPEGVFLIVQVDAVEKSETGRAQTGVCERERETHTKGPTSILSFPGGIFADLRGKRCFTLEQRNLLSAGAPTQPIVICH